MNFKEYKKGEYTIWECADGEKEWYLNGELHREDGPAVNDCDGDKEWWLNNKQYTEKEWKYEMRNRKLEALGI